MEFNADVLQMQKITISKMKTLGNMDYLFGHLLQQVFFFDISTLNTS